MGRQPEIPNSALPYSEFVEGELPSGIDWDDFRVFLAVVEKGSFNRGAEALGLAQPTASRRLAQLEKRLKVRLFDRDRSGARLTREGMRIYAEVSTARFSLARAARQGERGGHLINGDCKIVLGDGLANFWVPHFVNRFCERYPGIELKLFVSHDAAAGRNEVFDIQIHYYEPVEIDPISVKAGTLHFIPFASRAYLQRHPMPTSLKDLESHRMLGHTAYLIDKAAWTTWSQTAAAKAVSVLTNQSGPLTAMVRAGAGIALLPTYIVISEPDLVPLDFGPRFPMPFFLGYLRETGDKWAVRAVIDFLKNTVFDRKSMPWFADKYVAPSPSWRAMLEERLKCTQGVDDVKIAAARQSE